MLKNRENTVGFNDLFILRKNLRYPLLQCFGRTQIVYIYCIYIYIHTTYIPEIQDRYRKYQRLNGEVHFPTKASFFCYPFFNFWLKLCNLILSPKKQLHSDVSLPRPNPLGDTGRSAGRLITPRKELSDLQNLD